MRPLKNDPVITLLATLRDPAVDASARVEAAGTILETVLEEELAEVKRRIVALEARRQQKKQRRTR